jgi:hypothetical protein
LDKIFINLLAVAKMANHDDDLFFEILSIRLNDIFDLFSYKEMMVQKKLNQYRPWKQFIEDTLNLEIHSWANHSLKGVSFLNLNEAIKLHCGIELDRVKASEHFALKVISFMQKFLEEKNKTTNQHYVLTAPHILDNHSIKSNFQITHSMIDLIRRESNLSVKKKMKIFRKFQDFLKGGLAFPFYLDQIEDNILKLIKEINALEIDAFYFYP